MREPLAVGTATRGDEKWFQTTAIGQLEGKLDGLLAGLRTEQRRARAAAPTHLWELEEVRLNTIESPQYISTLKERLDANAPTIADVERWKERVIGMQMFAAFSTATLRSAIVTAGNGS